MKMRNCILALAATFATLPALAAGIDGKWNATVDGGPGGPIELVFQFKAEGEKLGGDITAAMMPAPMPISEGMIKGENVSFKLSVSMLEGAPPLVISYTGTLKGDALTLKSVMDMGMGEGPMETVVEAKRQPSTPATP
jgi:hypothetical protein